ncbi:MAG TPA: hypothetical protein V6D00_01790 [Pantanalinema sp.]
MRRMLLRMSRAATILAIAGCTQRALPDAGLIAPPSAIPVVEAPPGPAPPAPGAIPVPLDPCRFIAFTACRENRGKAFGGLFLWDEAVQDIYLLGGALAGLPLDDDCDGLDALCPRALIDGRVLFSLGGTIYLWEPLTETRATVALDARADHGGPRARISMDGRLLAYVSHKGTVVLKETDGAYFTKTRELTKIAAEAEARSRSGGDGVIEDLDLSGDGRWLVLVLDGILYLYDVLSTRLAQLLPLGGEALALDGGRLLEVAISLDGRFIAFVAGARLLVLDRASGMLDAVPYANLGLGLDAQVNCPAVPRFCGDGRGLLFALVAGGRRWILKYDVIDETLRGMTLLNNALGALPRV